jgi:competence protein ComEC
MRRIMLLLLLLGILTGCLPVGRSPAGPTSEMTLAVLDVGQGLAVAIVTPDGHALVYDAGNSRQDAERVIIPFLRAHGIERLDYAVLSHPDQDHVGGMPALLANFPVAAYVDPVLPSTNRAYAETLRLVAEKGIRPIRAERGLVLPLGEQVTARVLWPERPFLRAPDGTVSDNDNCVVLLVEYGAIRILLPGDLEERGEAELVTRDGEGLHADILVVGHHGSRTSSSEPFLAVVRPAVALISVGAGNPYGHPHRVTLDRLRRAGAQTYRTDLDGSILVVTDGSSTRSGQRGHPHDRLTTLGDGRPLRDDRRGAGTRCAGLRRWAATRRATHRASLGTPRGCAARHSGARYRSRTGAPERDRATAATIVRGGGSVTIWRFSVMSLLVMLLAAGCLPFGRATPTMTPTLVPTPTSLPVLPVVTPTPAPANLSSMTPTPTAPAAQPTGDGTTYVVQPGDTLYSIAVRFGVSLQALIEANQIEDPNQLQAGQVLVIPRRQ